MTADPSSAIPLVVFGSAPFDDGWLTEHHLARRSAQRRPVVFVEPFTSPLSSLRRAGAPRTPWGLARRAKVRQCDGVTVVAPLALPPVRSPAALWLSRPLVAAQVRRAMRAAEITDPVSLIAFGGPEVLGLAQERAHVLLVKDLNDAAPELLGVSAERIRADTAAVARGAQQVLAISSALQQTLASRGIASDVLSHGYDDQAPPARRSAPADLAALPRPWLGYLGRIDGRLDVALLVEIARRYAHGTLVLIGPVSPAAADAFAPVRALPNVAWLGSRPRADVPTYLAHFDCALLPYRSGAWAEHGSPLKLWDYLGAGAPIVGTGYSAVAQLAPPLAWFAHDPGAAPDLISRAMASSEDARFERQAHALANSWQLRVHEFERLVGLEP